MKSHTFFVLMMIVASSVSTIVTPAVALDYALGIFGNANMDETINNDDIAYVEGIIDGTNEETELADANYDGVIDEDDIAQIEQIIQGEEKELTIRDTVGKIVTVNMPINNVIAFNKEQVETMRSIKATDKIVGVSKYVIEDEFLADFVDYPNVGSMTDPNYETLLKLNPEIVLLYATFYATQCEAIQDQLNDLDPDIKVIRIDLFKPESYADETNKLGYLLGRTEESIEFIQFYESWMNSIKEKLDDIPQEEWPLVYFENRKPYYCAGNGTGHQQKIELAGGKNIFSDREGYFDVDPEAVVERNPEVIIRTEANVKGYSTHDENELRNVKEDIVSRPELADVIAVKNDDVYVINNQIEGGVKHFIGIGYMAKWLHPDLFEDLDPQAIHQDYLTRFQGLDYDLDENGVFVYPPQEVS
jgi:iron complex transport system substrate-binding protein